MKKQKDEKQQRKLDWLLDVLGLVRFALIFFLVIYLTMIFLVRPEVVSGRSMMPTLMDGDRGFTNIISNLLYDVERFDVVAVKEPNSKEQWVKRVIGLPKEHIAYRDGELYINGIKMEEPFLDETFILKSGYTKATFTTDMEEIVLGEDEYFLVGDNRPESFDSRARGPFQRSDLIGRHFYRFRFDFKMVDAYD